MIVGTYDAISHIDELRGEWPVARSLRPFENQQEALTAAETILPAIRRLLNPVKAVWALRETYHQDGFLRDILALTGTLRTFQGEE